MEKLTIKDCQKLTYQPARCSSDCEWKTAWQFSHRQMVVKLGAEDSSSGHACRPKLPLRAIQILCLKRLVTREAALPLGHGSIEPPISLSLRCGMGL